MIKENIVKDKSFAVAEQVMNVYNLLCELKTEYELSK